MVHPASKLAREPAPEGLVRPSEPTPVPKPAPASTASPAALAHHIIVVGGGAGGLVLATRLGDRLGRRGQARVTLVDCGLTHIWKPLLHEVAAGTLAAEGDGLDYFAHARRHHFAFELGRMSGLDRAAREIILDPVAGPDGAEGGPRRRLGYDTLVLAVGSSINDFGVPGVREHCLFLDSPAEAERIHRLILGRFLRGHAEASAGTERRLRFAIVGAGATGVELAAELRHAARGLAGYGLRGFDPERDVEVRLIEAAPSVLPALPERLQVATDRQLRTIGIEVRTGEQVARVTAEGVHTRNGELIPADLMVWTAGVKGPAWLADLDGLEVDRSNQLVVDPTLRTSRDEHVFALGDCAACCLPGAERPVPPRAQAAYQQAQLLAGSLEGRLGGRELRPFVYRDYGSLISLSSSTLGNLMGKLLKSVMIEGRIARLAYLSLYKKHQLSLHGLRWVTLAALANLLHRRTRPQLKLH
ncbi:MAG TPA: NAD(P)/FAD-dependent oxidoreductase [Geminicoccaceae bacterium]|jgi:NADH dehydrogenase|nr:NAD(P)/FAD-dependent oxidoreductase [Geminicoccaceae bacterium]